MSLDSKFELLILILVVPILLSYDALFAQNKLFEFKHSTNRSDFAAVSVDSSDSGFVVAGDFPLFSFGLQGLVLKFDKQGQTIWGASFGDAQDEVVKGVCATEDHGAIVAGYVFHPHDNVNYDIFLTKYDSTGGQQWLKYISNGSKCDNYAFDVQQAKDGGYVLAGFYYCSDFTVSPFINNQDYYVIKTDAGGNVSWTKTWSKSDYDLLDCIRVRADGGYVVAGTSSNNQGSVNGAYVAGLSSTGGIQWEYTGPAGSSNSATGVRELPSGGFIATALVDGADGADAQLIRLDSNGTLIWSKAYLQPGEQEPTDVEVECDGGFAIVGTDLSNFAKSADCFIMHVSPDGNNIWQQSYGLNHGDYARGAAYTPDGAIVVTAISDYITSPSLSFVGWVFKVSDGARRLTLLDGKGTPLNRKAVEFRHVLSTNPDWKDTLIYVDTTDDQGHVCACDTMFGAGEQFKVRKFLHSEPSTRHGSSLHTKYSVTVDNMKVNEFGTINFDTLATSRTQDVKLDHTTIGFDLLASIQWDTRDGYLNSLQNSFRALSNYLYDVYNGQIMLDTVVIFDQGVSWDDADIQIFASNMEWPRSTPTGFDDPNFASVKFPRQFFGTPDDTRNKTFTLYPHNLSDPKNYRTIGHELGHYIFGFGDEYVFVGANPRCGGISNYGYMDSQYPSQEPMASELSSALQYTDASCQNNDQYTSSGKSCWDQFEAEYQKTYGVDTVYAEIIKPTERTLNGSHQYADGPNDELALLDYNVGALAVFPEPDFESSTPNKIVTSHYRNTSTVLRKVNVELRKGSGIVVPQGQTSNAGKIRVFDVSPGDRIRAAGSARLRVTKKGTLAGVQEDWLFGEALPSGKGKSNLGNYFATTSADSIDLDLNPVQGNHRFIVDISLSDVGNQYKLYAEGPFAESPSLDHSPENGAGGTSLFSATGTTYKSTISGSLGGKGLMTITALDDSGATYVVTTDYATSAPSAGSKLFAYDGTAIFSADSLSAPTTQVCLATSGYPILRNGLTDQNVQAGKAVSLALKPDVTVSGSSSITIRYQDSDLELPTPVAGDESSLRIFSWDVNAAAWNLVGGSVDTVYNEVTGKISRGGVYAAFTTATTSTAPCGDMDGSGVVNVADVVFLISYIFASGPAPSPLGIGDVDCSGVVNLADGVYLINYIFAGGPAPCTACK